MLAGKLSLITGAGSGIGKATCQLMAKNGCTVVATDIENSENTLTTLEGINHMSLKLDVSNPEMVSDAIERVHKTYYKPPNILVNCAGCIRDNFLLNLSAEEFQQVLDINLKGTFFITQKVCAALVESNSPGSIINISSIVGKRGNRGQSNYAASKAGIIAFSKSVAMEMAQYNIRCNTIIPGFISTPMTEQIPDKVQNMFLSLIPCKRFGTPEEVAHVITFLASDASSYVNGTEICVSGGLE